MPEPLPDILAFDLGHKVTVDGVEDIEFEDVSVGITDIGGKEIVDPEFGVLAAFATMNLKNEFSGVLQGAKDSAGRVQSTADLAGCGIRIHG